MVDSAPTTSSQQREIPVQDTAKGELMSKQIPVNKPMYSTLHIDIEGFNSLAELALDLCARRGIMVPTRYGGSWIPRCGSPRATRGSSLQTVSRDQLQRLSVDRAFRMQVDAFVQPGVTPVTGVCDESLGQSEPSRTTRNVAGSVKDDRAATREKYSPKLLKS